MTFCCVGLPRPPKWERVAFLVFFFWQVIIFERGDLVFATWMASGVEICTVFLASFSEIRLYMRQPHVDTHH